MVEGRKIQVLHEVGTCCPAIGTKSISTKLRDITNDGSPVHDRGGTSDGFLVDLRTFVTKSGSLRVALGPVSETQGGGSFSS